MINENKNIPTILIILGATGDLIEKKITHALFHLSEKKKLISGFGKQLVLKKEETFMRD